MCFLPVELHGELEADFQLLYQTTARNKYCQMPLKSHLSELSNKLKFPVNVLFNEALINHLKTLFEGGFEPFTLQTHSDPPPPPSLFVHIEQQ